MDMEMAMICMDIGVRMFTEVLVRLHGWSSVGAFWICSFVLYVPPDCCRRKTHNIDIIFQRSTF